MKTTFLAISLLTLTAAFTSSFAQKADKLSPGDGIPGKSIMLKSTNTSDISLEKAGGKNGLIVMFSCNTCPFVIKNEPTIQKTMAYAASHGIGMVIVNSNEAKREGDDSYKAMKKYAADQNYTVPYVADANSQLADLFGANHTPEIFLFDKTGKLVYKGAMNDNPGDPSSYKVSYINNAIDALIAGKEINPNTTKSIGCSIKRKA